MLARDRHPDKPGGSSAAFHDASEVKATLESPLRFLAYRALRRTTATPHPFSPGTAGNHSTDTDNRLLRILTATATVELQDNWPYLTLDVEFSAPVSGLVSGSSFQIALSARGVSTIEYKGDDRAFRMGGYDMCCGFLESSPCKAGSTVGNGDDDDADEEGERFGSKKSCDKDEAASECGATCGDLFDPEQLTSDGIAGSIGTGDDDSTGGSMCEKEGVTGNLRACKDFADDGFCDLEWYQENCRRSCGLCGPSSCDHHHHQENTDSDCYFFPEENLHGPGTPGEEQETEPASTHTTVPPPETPEVVPASSDCPLQGRFKARVTKPLHLKRAGAWSAALLVMGVGGRDDTSTESRPPATCLSVAFDLSWLRRLQMMTATGCLEKKRTPPLVLPRKKNGCSRKSVGRGGQIARRLTPLMRAVGKNMMALLFGSRSTAAGSSVATGQISSRAF